MNNEVLGFGSGYYPTSWCRNEFDFRSDTNQVTKFPVALITNQILLLGSSFRYGPCIELIGPESAQTSHLQSLIPGRQSPGYR